LDGPDTPQPPEQLGAAIVAARLDTEDPLLISRRFGRGAVVLMTSAVDADWSTLPAKPDFVPLLHEIVFHLASGRAARNVDVGTPLVLPVPQEFRVDEYAFYGPGDTQFDAQPGGDELRPLVRLNDTRLPGIYELRPHSTTKAHGQRPVGQAQRPVGQAQPPVEIARETFVVNFDRGESDLTSLNEAERGQLEAGNRMQFIATQQQLREQMFADNSRTEFWQMLLFVFLGILVIEVVMTRRLVQGGHVDVEEPGARTREHSFAAGQSPARR
jgi:hypothetical protein